MIPYKNTVKHDPENGTYGDCHRACFCTILGIDPRPDSTKTERQVGKGGGK